MDRHEPVTKALAGHTAWNEEDLTPLAPALVSRTGGPYVDVYIILHDHPLKGLRIEILEQSVDIARRLLAKASVRSLVRKIEFLHSTLVDGQLNFTLA